MLKGDQACAASALYIPFVHTWLSPAYPQKPYNADVLVKHWKLAARLRSRNLDSDEPMPHVLGVFALSGAKAFNDEEAARRARQETAEISIDGMTTSSHSEDFSREDESLFERDAGLDRSDNVRDAMPGMECIGVC